MYLLRFCKTSHFHGSQGMEHRLGAERVVAGDSWAKTTCSPLATRQQSSSGARFTSHQRLKVGAECASTRSRTSSQARRGPRSSVDTSEPDDLKEKKVLDAALRKGKSQAVVPPVEDRIDQSMKFLERAKKRLAVADVGLQSAVQKKSQCEQEVAEAEADLARTSEEVQVPVNPDEDAKAEVQRLKARLVQLESIQGRPARRSVEAAENIRSKVAKLRVGCCAEDVLPSTEQDLSCWLDEQQGELRDALEWQTLD